jgi:ribonuclease HI
MAIIKRIVKVLNTTNNRMELWAIIAGLESITKRIAGYNLF